MHKNVFLSLLVLFFLTACAKKQTKQEQDQTVSDTLKSEVSEDYSTPESNPLLAERKLPYFAPPFDKIKDAHYAPALLAAMDAQTKEITRIAENIESPTFANTILAIEKSGKKLSEVASVFYSLASAHTNDVLKATQEQIAPKMSAHRDNIYLNPELFARVKNVYEQRDNLTLDPESATLLEEYYTNFTIAGANLSDEKKQALKQINEQLATLSTKFNQTLLEANNNGTVEITEAEAAGLSEETKKANKSEAGYKISLLNTTQQPLLKYLEERTARQKLFDASIHRADKSPYNTEEIVADLALLRAKKAKLLGFPNYAAWRLQKTMAKKPEAVIKMYEGIVASAVKKANAEAKDIQKMIKSEGKDFTLAPHDWSFYAEKVRKQKYDLDESQLKPYFDLKTVLEKGVFYAAEKLYGITFKTRTDFPTYHPDVMVYEFFEEDGTPLGLFYGDYFARKSKRGGAWMSNFIDQSGLYNQKPVVYNVCNYVKPPEGAPALLSYDEVTTLFHEFGHALHGLFANQQYPSLSGTAVARDFVEYPSQFNENWALHPEILKNYALHYETKEVIPDALIKKIKNAATFNQGYALCEALAAGNLDMQWHLIGADNPIESTAQFETEALKKVGLLLKEVPPRYRSTYFAHVFGGGYAAGYYAYLWTEMLAHDSYDWFVKNGGLSRENGERYRKMILSQGNTQNYEEMYKKFRGSLPKTEPLLKARGL